MKRLNCSMCGYDFDADGQAACQSCPLHQGCTMVCCPACGYTTIDHTQSGLVRRISKLWQRRKGHTRRNGLYPTLEQISPGTRAKVFAFHEMEKRQIENLQAFGLSPGQWVRVIQHAPVTVVEVGNTELALEGELAGQVIMADDPEA